MKVEDFQEMPWWQIPVKIVSGGQTGVDRAALDAARAAHLPYGGWLPKGRLTEEGPLPEEYVGMSEMPTKDYLKRTEKNVVDSDMTVVVCRGEPEGGTKRTVGFAEKHGRPCRVCDLERDDEPMATFGHCWGLSPKVGNPPSHTATEGRGEGPKPKSSRERRVLKKGK